jgi:RAB protein geranylgeranyltransferase component A
MKLTQETNTEVENKSEENFLQEIKLWRMICYCICGFRFNIENTNGVTCRDFLEKFNLFVRSMGIHQKMPYLYPMYGAADITQVFSRIGAVYGGNFVLNKEMIVEKIEFGCDPEESGDDNENEEKVEIKPEVDEKEEKEKEEKNEENIKESKNDENKNQKSKKEELQAKITLPNRITFSAGGEEMTVGFKQLICGPEYNEAIMKISNQSQKIISERVLQTIHVVLKCNLSIESEKIPHVIIYPENNEKLKNKNVIRANVLSWNSKSTPLEYVYLNISFEKWEGMDLDYLREEIVKDAQTKVERELTPKYHFVNERVYR